MCRAIQGIYFFLSELWYLFHVRYQSNHNKVIYNISLLSILYLWMSTCKSWPKFIWSLFPSFSTCFIHAEY